MDLHFTLHPSWLFRSVSYQPPDLSPELTNLLMHRRHHRAQALQLHDRDAEESAPLPRMSDNAPHRK